VLIAISKYTTITLLSSRFIWRHMPKGDKFRLKADPEDGTTPIANLLLEAVAMANIPGLQTRAILYLWRKTYGWIDEDGKRKKKCEIGLKEWTDALDVIKSSVATALSELERKNIIIRTANTRWGTYYYSFNTDIVKWDNNCINLPLLLGHRRTCIRCGCSERIENHHITPKSEGGGDEIENKEPRCQACHKYEHAKRHIIASLEKARRQKQPKRIVVFANRLEALEELNTPKLIKQYGYRSWFECNDSLHYLPLYEKVIKNNPAQYNLQLSTTLKGDNNG